ncbi:von Willebrand factor type A domain protein [Lysobacter antibioticus]|uniref:vWA domain-containing protein n=1 Tax=Lysobacter antibioticus TaxID=84531 RepID=UPI0007170F7B|nr:VWA domain-containing protein [Lysobacter antibioticus]ALN66031.1 von Willebrand factor type A domain protein [Lysobacter antibioticus]
MSLLSDWRELFAWPWWLLALPLPLLARWLLPAARDASAALKVPFGERLDAIAAVGGRNLRGGSAGWLLWLAWALLCIAAARPQQLGEAVQPPQVGRDMMLALDLSGSMSEPDMALSDAPVDRLTAAKAVLADFLDRRVGDRIGLIVFGRRAYVLTPLTLDRDTVRDQLKDSVVGLAGQETAIGDAVGLAVKRLREQPSGQRVLILLTDGVNTAGALDPNKAAELARDHQVRIHTIAFGGDGSMSLFGFKIAVPGGDPLDETSLRAIAQTTGGRFFRARDTAELAGIYAEIDRIEPVQRPGKAVRPRIERYIWPLAAAFGMALLAFAWPRRRPA